MAIISQKHNAVHGYTIRSVDCLTFLLKGPAKLYTGLLGGGERERERERQNVVGCSLLNEAELPLFCLSTLGGTDMNIMEKLLILLLSAPNLINWRRHICDSLNENNKGMAAYHLSSPTSSLLVHSALRQFRQPARCLGLCYWHAATMKKLGTGQIVKSLSLSLSLSPLSLILSLYSKVDYIIQMQCRGLLHKIVRFETYLPVGTNFGGWYVCIIFHDVIFLRKVPISVKRTYR